MVNDKWTQEGLIAQANFGLLRKYSDHSPCVVSLFGTNDQGANPFKLFNMWTQHVEFWELVGSVRSMHVEGSTMFKLCRKAPSFEGL